jgi:hypothetical protein
MTPALFVAHWRFYLLFMQKSMELVIQNPSKKQAIKKRPKALFQLDT